MARPARLGPVALLLAVLSAPPPTACLAVVLSPGGALPVDLLVGVLGLSAHGLAAWLLAVAALTLGARAPARAGRACTALLACCAPVAVRRAVAVALGAGLALGLPGPAAAQTAGPAPTAAPAGRAFDWPGLSTYAVRPPVAAPPPEPAPDASTTRPRVRPPAPRDHVVVRPGDTLWDLAARSLPAPVTHADRAAAWPRWWAANRDVVGDDPDLLLPGQRLVAPPAR